MGSSGSRILDGWALLPTWSPLTAIGYEIKVSRSDWLQDQKFEEYRGCCHLFLVVAPPKVVAASEMPAGVGLLEPVGQGDGQRLVMRVKPVRQEADFAKLSRLMAHALMWKKGIGGSSQARRERQIAYWQSLVDQRERGHTLGREVKGRIRDTIRELLSAAQTAESRANTLQWAAEVFDSLGIRPGYDRWSTERNITQALGSQRENLLRDIDQGVAALRRLRDIVGAEERAKTA